MTPDPPRRWATTKSRLALASRLQLPYAPSMQDWEWEVADPTRYPIFLAAYRGGSDDERFSLMECLVQSVADMAARPGGTPPEWAAVADLLRADPRLHASTITYWSRMTGAEGWEWAGVGAAMRQVWSEVQAQIA